jgi:hypothetical protein
MNDDLTREEVEKIREGAITLAMPLLLALSESWLEKDRRLTAMENASKEHESINAKLIAEIESPSAPVAVTT